MEQKIDQQGIKAGNSITADGSQQPVLWEFFITGTAGAREASGHNEY
jgi:hypothetical protein